MSELDHMDALAAEYVLGSLDFEERAQARNLLEADPTFAAQVQLWERRFGELHLMVEPVEPDSSIWVRIKAKLPEVQQGIRAPQPPLPPATPAPAAAEPPSLDAIEAAISQAATTLSVEASSVATPEAALQPPSEVTTVSEAMPVPASETAAAPTAEAPPAPSPDVTRTFAVEAVPSLPIAPAPAAAPQPVRDQAMESTTAVVRRRLRRWQAYAIFMTLVVAAVAVLLAAWRFAPDRVPPVLQPLEVMRQVGVTLPAGPAQRRPAPPESRFDE